MNNVEKLKQVKEALEAAIYYAGSPHEWKYEAEQVLPLIDELIDQQSKGVDEDLEECIWHKINNVIESKLMIAGTKRTNIVDEIMEIVSPRLSLSSSKGVDALTEVEMIQVAGVLFNAGHEELSKKAYNALKAGCLSLSGGDGYREGTKQLKTDPWVSIIWRAEKILRDGMESGEDIDTTVERLRADLQFHYPQPKAPAVSEGELVEILMGIPVQEAEFVENHLAIPSHYMDEITARRFTSALSERGVLTVGE